MIINKKSTEGENFNIDLGIWEQTWFLNFQSRNKDLYDFSSVVYNCANRLIEHFKKEEDKNNAYCTISILFLAKSVRLFRASVLLLEKGYFPEASLLFRPSLELSLTLQYIINDKSGERARKWIEMDSPKARWDFQQLLKIYKDESLYKKFYEMLSLYTHTHILGMSEFSSVEDELMHIEVGPMCGVNNYAKSSEKFKYAAMHLGGICETIGNSFLDKKNWEKLHKPIEDHEVYKDSLSKISEEDMKRAEEFLGDILG